MEKTKSVYATVEHLPYSLAAQNIVKRLVIINVGQNGLHAKKQHHQQQQTNQRRKDNRKPPKVTSFSAPFNPRTFGFDSYSSNQQESEKNGNKNDSSDCGSSSSSSDSGTIDLRICDLPFDAMIIMGAAELIPYRHCGWLAKHVHVLGEVDAVASN